jgi:predicted transcriptional regulator
MMKETVIAQKKPYKSYELYCSFALNRLVAELNINLYQDQEESKLDDILAKQEGLSKGDIKYEIKSNNHMTNKVLTKLEKEGLIEIMQQQSGYNIKITKKGLLHVKKFNEFYWEIFSEHIIEHYRYRKLPIWFEKLK